MKSFNTKHMLDLNYIFLCLFSAVGCCLCCYYCWLNDISFLLFHIPFIISLFFLFLIFYNLYIFKTTKLFLRFSFHKTIALKLFTKTYIPKLYLLTKNTFSKRLEKHVYIVKIIALN